MNKFSQGRRIQNLGTGNKEQTAGAQEHRVGKLNLIDGAD